MGLSLYHFMLMQLFFLFSCFHLIIVITNSSSSTQPLCHDDEISALLQFKQSFSINRRASDDPSAYPKVVSWKLQGEGNDCCSWDGVECDEGTGHVIGLNLTSSLLYGSINSNSSLFRLVHLQRLHLADNHFNYSQIPSQIGHLLELRSLDLSYSVFSGQFPTGIFHLPKLQVLSLQFNQNLTGYLPEFHHSNPLKILELGGTSFFGKLPDSIGNLSSLILLDLRECHFSGLLPTSLSNLTQLTILELWSNNFSGQIPSLASLSQLTSLSLSFNNFNPTMLPWIGRLKKLSQLLLDDINMYGKVPVSLANLTQLTVLSLSLNHLSGQIPSWLMNLTQLTAIDLYGNQLQGPVDIDIFLKLRNLTALQLSDNNLSLHSSNRSYGANVTLPKFKILGLSSCNLREFPHFLRFQDELVELFLEDNNIHGQIPEWMWNSNIETLGTILLSNNYITSFENRPIVLPWTTLGSLDLRFNMLQGSLPIPPPSTFFYVVSNNILIGKIPQRICQLSSLRVLDLSNNKFSGEIPPCLGNFSNSLSVLNLKGNNFNGTIPQTYSVKSKLRMIDLSENHLQGQIPRSLVNCAMLQLLNLGNNQIEDTFPFWLGDLSELQVLILQSNKFHGAIWSPKANFKVSKLRIVDLSGNGFTGNLPHEFFQNLNAMKIVHADKMAYLQENTSFQMPYDTWDWSYFDSMTITYKGVKTKYVKIPDIFIAIDLSSNKFNGPISNYIGNLKGLQLLNLSGNDLIGLIPSSFANLTNLESLDLSQNKLSGEIPQQLLRLNFLEILNVSHNNLTGPIPRGKQFDTFENNSYQGNSGLCGEPLSKKCGISTPPSPMPPLAVEEGNDSEFPSEFDWIFIFAGCGSGLIVGLIIGHNLTTRYHEWFQSNWFVKTFGRKQQKPRRKAGQRN